MEGGTRREIVRRGIKITFTLLGKLVVVMRVASPKDLLAAEDSGKAREESFRFGERRHSAGFSLDCDLTNLHIHLSSRAIEELWLGRERERLIGNNHECGTREERERERESCAGNLCGSLRSSQSDRPRPPLR